MSTENTSIDESSSGIDSSIQDPIENNFSMSAAGRTKKPAVDVVEAYSDEMDEDDEQEVAAPAENAFETWNLSKEVLKSLAEMKFTTPTAIQKQAIPLLLSREKDFVGLAATGTGKTGAFGIPLVETIDASSKSVQALVMCPTRELAAQVEAQLQKMAKWKGLNTLTVFGGSSYDRQVTALKRGVHIVVGTPGRLCDLIDRKVLKLNDVQTLVLDEADEMISMGFQDDLEKILGAIGDDESKRKWLFSATMSPEIRRVVSRYLPDYDKIEIHKQDSEKPQIEQIYYTIYPDRKLQMLSSVLYMNPEFYGLIFCQTKREVQEITEWLKRKSFKVDCIHGDRPQRERDFILKDFRSGRVKILVATDVAARGLDINDLTHVINFSLPREVESYTHRIGRTGRAGKKGLALSIVAPHEVRLLKRIQQVTKATMTKGRAPSNDELNLFRVKDAISSLNAVDPKEDVAFRANKFLDRKMAELKELFTFEFTVEEFLKRYLVSDHPDIFENRDTSMDFVGDGVVPREMQDYGSRERGPVGRDRSGPREGGRSYGGGRDFGRPSFRGGDRGDRGGDRFDRGERGGRFAGGGGFKSRGDEPKLELPIPRGESRPERSYERSTERSERPDRGFAPRRDEGAAGRFDRPPRRERTSEARSEFSKPEGRTWNADDSGGDRPPRKRFSNSDSPKPSRKSY
jgi:ATP-dependent RNA helicase DeaD